MHLITPAELLAIACEAEGRHPCQTCAPLVCPGWEQLPAGFAESDLQRLGTLRVGEDEPGWDEYHPSGTRLWSADAPIAPGFHPYNRSEVWACARCARPFLRWTEFGGYYEDRRVRELQAALVHIGPGTAG